LLFLERIVVIFGTLFAFFNQIVVIFGTIVVIFGTALGSKGAGFSLILHSVCSYNV
jgi:hypothetical protein